MTFHSFLMNNEEKLKESDLLINSPSNSGSYVNSGALILKPTDFLNPKDLTLMEEEQSV